MATRSGRKKRKKTIVWSQDEDTALLASVLEYSNDEEDIDLDGVDWAQVADKIPGKTIAECTRRPGEIHQKGSFFATIEEVWPESQRSSISLSGWDACKTKVCRKEPPNFERLQLSGDNRDPNEFVVAYKGAHLDTTAVGKSVTTVNDGLIPVDIFGETKEGAHKAHLLPKARDEALTWLYPGSAVLGLDMNAVDGEIAKKAVLGCIDSHTDPETKYPGIRNMLCNILRVASQADFYDNSPRVFVFPIIDLDAAKKWTGKGYEAIVLCESGGVSQRIGMTNAALGDAKRATLSEIQMAATLASTLCEFLAHSVLEKGQLEVDKYQDVGGQREAHRRFREEKEIPVPKILSAKPRKPVCKISFVGHNEPNNLGNGHPAPDPMLLGFKSCNNWCRRNAGFRMVAGAEAEELDDLSEEGQRNLQAYVEWQAASERTQQHNDIMNIFGREGRIEFAT